MSSIFSPDAPEPPPVPDRSDVTGAEQRLRERSAQTGRNQTLLTSIRDRGNTGMRPRAEMATLLGG
jgi:hypothetical protein